MVDNYQNVKHVIQVPASSTNLGPGFDALGLALELFLRVEVEETSAPKNEIELAGGEVKGLPDNENNLIWRVMKGVFAGEGRQLPSVRIKINNEIPLARGLGSSAAAIVAGISCYEALTGFELSPERFFSYAVQHEKEPDNITAARYGGFTITSLDEHEQVTFYRSNIDTSLQVILTIPDFQLLTDDSRFVLPQDITLKDAVYNIQRSSLMVAAMLRNEIRLLSEALKDKVHQPYRAELIPGFKEILDLNSARIPGLIGSCLSGAGSSVLTFFDSNAAFIQQRLQDIFKLHGITTVSLLLKIDNQGRTISKV